MTVQRSPFHVRLVGEHRSARSVTAEDRLRGRNTAYTFDVSTDYARQRYVIVSSDLDEAYRDLEEEVRAGVAWAGSVIPYSGFDPRASALFDDPNSSYRGALLLAGIATFAGYGIVQLATRWRESRVITDVGYEKGRPFDIFLVTIDGKPVQVDTARAFKAMREAAAGQGIRLTVVSGFRTMDAQRYLYRCYREGNCNNGNLAARPGYSNHQTGLAIDLNHTGPGVLVWLRARAGEFGFKETIASEPWHWERKATRG